MELNKNVISSIASVYGISAEDLTAKLTSEEPQELKLAGQLFTDDELSARDSGKYNEGKTAAGERIAKDFKQKYGYELDGVKDVFKVLEHHEEQLKTKFSKGGSDRVKELENDIEKLKNTYETEIEELKTSNSDIEARYKKQITSNQLLSMMPKETTIKKEAILTLFNANYEIDQVDGLTVVKQNGEILKDPKTTNPVELKTVFNNWLSDENYIKKAPGRGEGDETGNIDYTGIKTPEQFQEKWKRDNPDKNINSPEYEQDYIKFRTQQRKSA